MMMALVLMMIIPCNVFATTVIHCSSSLGVQMGAGAYAPIPPVLGPNDDCNDHDNDDDDDDTFIIIENSLMILSTGHWN